MNSPLLLPLPLQDLERYHTALDTALQRYHKLKASGAGLL